MAGKCPKCEKLMGNVKVEPIEAHAGSGASYKAIKFTCPFCFTILGVQIDPLTLKADTVAALKKALR